MTKKSKQFRLKNRFNNIENLLMDQVEKVEPLQVEIPQVKKEMAPETKPLIFVYMSFAYRSTKVLTLYLFKSARLAAQKVLGPLCKELGLTLSYTYDKLSGLRKLSEINFDNYITSIEQRLLEQEIVEKKPIRNDLAERETNTNNVPTGVQETMAGNGLAQFESELAHLFHDTPLNIKIECEKNEEEKVKASLEYEISLYEFVVKKLLDTKMIINVDKVNLKSQITAKTIINTLEFDLKVSAEKWSRLFAKNISSGVFSRIENYNGKVKNVHTFNTRLKIEKFSFVFSHQRMDVFMEETRVEEVKKEKTVYRQAQIEI